MLPFVQVLFRSTLTDIDYGKADTQRRGADALFLDAGPVVRARTGCALARTETSFQYVIDDGAWPLGERVRRTQSLWRHLPVLSARQRGGVQPQDAEGRGEQVFRQFLPRGGFVARTGGENLRGRSARPDPANRKSNRKTIVLCRPFCFTV